MLQCMFLLNVLCVLMCFVSKLYAAENVAIHSLPSAYTIIDDYTLQQNRLVPSTRVQISG